MIGCANLGEEGEGRRVHPYLADELQQQWHKDWFYLRNDTKNPLSEYALASIAMAPKKWSFRTEKAEQVRPLKGCWEVLTWLHAASVDLAAIICSYHKLGIVSLQRRALRIYQMMPTRCPSKAQ
jgi:hypothetical protein